MTYKEMQTICKNNKGKCKKCILNCIEDWNIWNPDKSSWCLKAARERYINKYKMHKERGQTKQAEETIKQYATLEQKYLKKGV